MFIFGDRFWVKNLVFSLVIELGLENDKKQKIL